MRGVILAGGRSSRFGRDKAWEPVEGVPMALRVANAMRGAGLDPVVVARSRDLEALGLEVVVEPEGRRHPLNGLLPVLGDEAILIAPCDVPFITSTALSRLAACEGAAVATDGEREHWLLGRIPPGWRPRVLALWEREGPVRSLWEGAERVRLPAEVLHNVNRPADLRD